MTSPTTMTLAGALKHAVLQDDLDAACAIIQDALGVTDGGVAGICFSDLGESEESLTWKELVQFDRHERLVAWIKTELDYMSSPQEDEDRAEADIVDQDEEGDQSRATAIEAFRATRQEMSGKAFGELVGDRAWEDAPGASLLVYEGRWYIEVCDDGRRMLTLENRGWITGDGVSLEDLERELFEFSRMA